MAGFAGAGGFATYNKSQFDSFLNSWSKSVDGNITQGQAFVNFMAAHPDSDFTATPGPTVFGPVGYTSADIGLVRSASNDAATLFSLWTGGQASPYTVRDLRAFIKQLTTLGM